jgi:hypothetical protein
METFTLVVWLAGTIPIGICSGMGTGVPDAFYPDLSREQCEQKLQAILRAKPGARAFCTRNPR